jgi:hypothetical protein
MAKAKQADKFIVLCHHHEACENVLFMMAADDFRFGTPEYKTVTGGRLTKERRRSPNGVGMQVFKGADGKDYGVFADWSARVL